MLVRTLGLCNYRSTAAAMQTFTEARSPSTADELWLCEHPPTFTLGLASKPEHLINTGDIEVVPTNRGGQVTYHGPGQVVAYPLLDLRRLGIFVKEYVYRVEQSVIQTLAEYEVLSKRVAGAPGIYTPLPEERLEVIAEHPRAPQKPLASDNFQPSPYPLPSLGEGETFISSNRNAAQTSAFNGLAKIAALGIKVSRQCTYHGVALNVAMDLAPFNRINPCGYAGLQTTDLATLGVNTSWADAATRLAARLQAHLTHSKTP
jgi:lipoyl(octanoyl) transferase